MTVLHRLRLVSPQDRRKNVRIVVPPRAVGLDLAFRLTDRRIAAALDALAEGGQ